MKLVEPIVAFASEIKAIRRDIHAHPELSFQEHRTADLVARTLSEWGIPVHRGLGGTGVVGMVRAGQSARAIGLRADMDALPVKELNTFAHASRHAGIMHACGHDGHTAMLLGAARYLAQTRRFDGTVYLIFQPAEEDGGGALRMMADGLFQRFPMEAVFGMHNWPGMKAGQFGLTSGPIMASSNEFEVVVRGLGGHGALPHNAVDPVMVAVQIAQGWQSVITRNKKPVDAAVLSITQIHAGNATNVIPDTATLAGTVRTFSIEVLDMVERRMRDIAHHTAQAFGATMEFRFQRNYPPTVNHPRQAALCAEVMRGIVGAENVDADIEPTMGAEDFAFMLLEKPGCYVFLGNGEGEHREVGHGLGPCMLHNPSYDFNDDLLPLGATYWARLAEAYLAPQSGS